MEKIMSRHRAEKKKIAMTEINGEPMNCSNSNGTKLFLIAIITIIAFTFTQSARSQNEEKNLGKVQQGLVGGVLVSPQDQERYGLLTLTRAGAGCSASLLRNEWVITAAHCIDDPVPGMPGQFTTVPENSVTLTANWVVPQQKKSVRIISFRPLDIAIIRVATPFSVNGSTGKFNQELFQNSELKDQSITVLGRGINQFAFEAGEIAMPSQSDNMYRLGILRIQETTDVSYSFPRVSGQSMAGGDSGGPSYIYVGGKLYLVGVHSNCGLECLPGKTCGAWPGPGPAPANYSNWEWVSGTPNCSDVRVTAVWDEVDRYIGAFTPQPDPVQFIGTFGTTPQNYQPMWVYAITDSGDMMWYRKDTGTANWQGPKKVGNGWNFKDVIPAGGNSIYALTEDGKLMWYRHDGFNDGSFNWTGPVQVGNGWTFSKIISGGDGIIYALKADGTLLWYQHTGYADGSISWNGPKVVGSGWESFKDIFSSGKGAVYAVKTNGDLVLYNQTGFETGEKSWTGPRTVGTGWGDFRQIIPVGDGVILAIQNDGKLRWYKHYGLVQPNRYAHIKEKWDGAVEIGSGWQGFKKVIALIPVTAASIVR